MAIEILMLVVCILAVFTAGFITAYAGMPIQMDAIMRLYLMLAAVLALVLGTSGLTLRREVKIEFAEMTEDKPK